MQFLKLTQFCWSVNDVGSKLPSVATRPQMMCHVSDPSNAHWLSIAPGAVTNKDP